MEINLNRYIQSVGKTTFIYCFELFKNDDRVLNDYEFGELIRGCDPTQTNNESEGLKMKASFARGIFKAGREKEALEICINAKKITEDVRTIGKNYYDKYYGNNIPEQETYQNKVQKASLNINNIKNYQERPEAKLNNRNQTYSVQHARSPQKAKEALFLANFMCEIDKNHKTFISKTSGKNYVEAHHLIPMEFENKFTHSIDVHSNIIALCPNCHRAIHNANEKTRKELIEILYKQRKERLKKQGIDINLTDLYKMYE